MARTLIGIIHYGVRRWDSVVGRDHSSSLAHAGCRLWNSVEDSLEGAIYGNVSLEDRASLSGRSERCCTVGFGVRDSKTEKMAATFALAYRVLGVRGRNGVDILGTYNTVPVVL